MNVEDVVFPYIVLGAIDVKVSFFDNEEDEEKSKQKLNRPSIDNRQ